MKKTIARRDDGFVCVECYKPCKKVFSSPKIDAYVCAKCFKELTKGKTI